jgi:hypothetical protein
MLKQAVRDWELDLPDDVFDDPAVREKWLRDHGFPGSGHD